MKKVILGFLISAGLALSGTAVGYPLYKDHVEKSIAGWIEKQNQDSISSNLSYESLTADPIDGRIKLTGITFEHDEMTLTAERGVLIIDSAMLAGSATAIESGTFRTIHLTGDNRAQINAERLEILDLSLDPSMLSDANAPLDIFIRSSSARSLVVNGVDIVSGTDAGTLQFDTLGFYDLRDGRIDRIAVDNTSFQSSEVSGTFGELEILSFDLASLAELNRERADLDSAGPEAHEISATLGAMAIRSISVSDAEVADRTGLSTGYAYMGFTNIDYDDGVPVAGRFRAKDFTQAISQETRAIWALMLPFHFAVPASVTSTLDLSYDLDSTAGTLDISVTEWDSATNVDSAAQIAVSGLQPLLGAISGDRDPTHDEFRQVTLNRFFFVMESREEWTQPATGPNNRPDFRLFALNSIDEMGLRNLMPPSLIRPVENYLQAGGRVALMVRPEPAISISEFETMSHTPLNLILERLSATAEYTPFGAD